MKRALVVTIAFILLSTGVVYAVATGTQVNANGNNRDLVCNGQKIGEINAPSATVGRSPNSPADNLNNCLFDVRINYDQLSSTPSYLGRDLVCNGVVIGSVTSNVHVKEGFIGPIVTNSDGTQYPANTGCDFLLYL